MRTVFLFLLVYLPSLHAFTAKSQEELDAEAKHIADFLFHAVQFIEWPQELKYFNELHFCALVQSDNSAAHQLERKFAFISGGLPIKIKMFATQDAALTFNQEEVCHFLYLDTVYSDLVLSDIFQRAKHDTFISIGHGASFIEKGGAFSFIGSNRNKLSMYANPENRVESRIKFADIFNKVVSDWPQ
ncbi:YfiR family protein [Catenovulum sp. SM1970]|uniref:YfiR family protein n=1 Tax=Marinifaba aquimaris TaxID=2741323 RepID=UPI0015718729|nr:YfiR family protein [Marinifaba aquimaris]NTS78582.1 YfiR family protein [Marinifaba aquimaris]